MVASDIPAIRETVKDKFNGILCNHEKPLEFIRGMQYISDHPLEAHKMGINGIVQVEEKAIPEIRLLTEPLKLTLSSSA